MGKVQDEHRKRWAALREKVYKYRARGWAMERIGQKVGVSRQRVSQILAKQ